MFKDTKPVIFAFKYKSPTGSVSFAAKIGFGFDPESLYLRNDEGRRTLL